MSTNDPRSQRYWKFVKKCTEIDPGGGIQKMRLGPKIAKCGSRHRFGTKLEIPD
jgi:hypothetical protein